MTARPSVRWAAALAVLAAASGSCGREDQGSVQRVPPTPASVERSAEARRALVAWFECEECTEGELEKVLRYGDMVVPNLAAALQGGLSPSKREEARLHLRETYRELTRYAKDGEDGPVPMSEQRYLDVYLGNFDSLYRLRAATALGRIATPAAKDALRRSLELANLRADVRRSIESNLNR